MAIYRSKMQYDPALISDLEDFQHFVEKKLKGVLLVDMVSATIEQHTVMTAEQEWMVKRMDDLISRQAAIDAIYHHLPSVSRTRARTMLHEVPSAQTDVPDINDGDIISRRAVQEMIDRIGGMYPYRQIGNRDSYSQYNEAWTDAINRVDAELNSLPSVQPEAKPPKWVAEDRYVKNRFAVFPHCPRCNAGITTGQCYCMICGQHIDWSEDDG